MTNAIKPSVLFVLTIVGCISCSGSTEPKLEDGWCETNDDCKQGARCNMETKWCEDIYHPRRAIKNY